MESTIISIVSFICLVLYIGYEKFVLPNKGVDEIKSATEVVDTVVDTAKKLDMIFAMAKKFVILAKKEFKEGQGEEKKNWVIKQLRSFCEKLDIVLSNEELEAINEDAYNNMKKDEKVTE